MILLLLLVLALAVICILLYNSLINKRNAIDNAYYSIDVMLKKRYELIPMLVETVKGYMNHERDLLEGLVRLRSSILKDKMAVDRNVDSDNKVNEHIRLVLLLAEAYPVLKSSPSFLHLQGALNESEEQLAASRRFLNAAVMDYHNALQRFPSNLIAALSGMKQRNYFILPEEEKVRRPLYFNQES